MFATEERLQLMGKVGTITQAHATLAPDGAGFCLAIVVPVQGKRPARVVVSTRREPDKPRVFKTLEACLKLSMALGAKEMTVTAG